jgi:hypothetical protein
VYCLDEILRNAAQTKPSQQELGSILDVLNTGLGVIVEHRFGGWGGGEGPLGAWQGIKMALFNDDYPKYLVIGGYRCRSAEKKLPAPARPRKTRPQGQRHAKQAR